MFCQACGMEVASAYKICPNCGGRDIQIQQPPHKPQVVPAAQSSPQVGAIPIHSVAVQSNISPSVYVYASFWRRLGGYLIDYIVLFLIIDLPMIGLLSILGISWGDELSLTVNGWWILISFVGVTLYHVLLESGSKQSTFGKRMLGMKVVDTNGQRISFGRAVGRFFSKFLSAVILLIGYLMPLWTERRQALHDKIAGTYVIYKGGR